MQLVLEHSTSLHILPLSGTYHEPDLTRLEELIEYSARLLPAEGPLGSFAFQNPLHAFEYLPFDKGVRAADRLFGSLPYLPEEQYRQALKQKRIEIVDLRSVLEEEPKIWESVEELTSRLDLRLAFLLNPIVEGSAEEITWAAAECGAFTKLRGNLSSTTRERVIADVKRWVVRDLINAGGTDGRYVEPGPGDPRLTHVLWPIISLLKPVMYEQERGRALGWEDSVWESFATRALWQVCCEGVRAAGPRPDPVPRPGERPRDLLFRATGTDSDGMVHDLLIRFCAAFSDQGLAAWQMPDKPLGFFKAFCNLYSVPGGPPDLWLRGLRRELTRIQQANFGPMDSIRESLDLLGIASEEWEAFLPATVLKLRGWGSIIRQMEVRADRVPHPVPRGTLIELLAVRLILERLALAHVAREEMNYTGPLDGLRDAARARIVPPAPTIEGRAYVVFQLAQSFGWKPSVLHALGASRWANLMREIESFPEIERQRIFHKAYERRLRLQILDAVAIRTASPIRKPAQPRFQISCCIDAREEAFRRHLEEVCPDAETFGAPGFFGVPIYYRGVGDAHPEAQCPIVIRPQHWVVEEPVYPHKKSHKLRSRIRRIIGLISHRFHLGTRSAATGAVVTGLFGSFSSVFLILRVLFPRFAAHISKTTRELIAPPPITRLVMERSDPAPGPVDGGIGFNLEEMTNLGEKLLRDIGLTKGFARLVIFFGHGSQSLNNPHLAAYNCGACSGNPGGANARTLAAMLNDKRVRAGMAARGLVVPEDTVFVGAFHNTGDETVTFYDTDLLPRTHHADLRYAQAAIEETLERNAREKCRRFYSAPLSITQAEARRHVQTRVEDLAQTRPEFGNASNALCIVGRRERIRGLFLDRRAFMQSYDPTQDTPTGTILARILSAVIPVCQGINLTYYFSAMGPYGLGAGTKLPHNIVSMLGVMDGAQSDLKQGLPMQGVEIHEPVRLLFVIESYPEVILGIMKANPAIDRIIRNGWAQLALLNPGSSELRVFEGGEFQLHHPSITRLPKAGASADWYSGSRGNLEFADIDSVNAS